MTAASTSSAARTPGATRRRLALLGGGSEQVIAVRVAQALGYDVVVFDDTDQPPAAQLANACVRTTIKDADALLAAARPLRIEGVFTHAAELAVEQAMLAERLGLPGLSVDAAERGTLKHLRIRALEESGIRVPAHRRVAVDEPRAAWHVAASAVGYPLVAKPCNEKGARGVQLVRDAAALDVYFDARESALASPVFLLESFEIGMQISSESVFTGGRSVWHAMALRHYNGMERFHPYLIEDGHSMPLELEPRLRSNIEALIDACAESIGVRDGVLKGDLLVRDDGTIFVIEMAARTSGGRFADFVTPLHCGVNVLEALIPLAMGDAFDPAVLEPRAHRGVSQRFVFLAEGSRAARAPRAELMRVASPTEAVVFQPRFLATLEQAPIRSHHDRIGYVVCTGETRDDADRSALDLCAALHEDMT